MNHRNMNQNQLGEKCHNIAEGILIIYISK